MRSSSIPAWSNGLIGELEGLRSFAAQPTVWGRLPIIRAAERGIAGDGKTDVTEALQSALDSLSTGGTLVLDPGVYVHSRCLEIRRPHVRIMGRGARLHASNPADMCLLLAGDETQILDLELTANTIARGAEVEQARVVMRGRGSRVLNTRIVGATSAGIYVQGARDFAVIGNHVSATLADGIYSSDGAMNGLIARNVVSSTGDDGISVVSYRSSARCARILIEDNQISNIAWARGIAVVGSSDVVVRNNSITGTGRAAGIIVTREEFYDTYGVERVVVMNNVVSEVARRFRYPRSQMT